MINCNCTGINDGVHATWCPLSRTETVAVTANTVMVDEKRLILLSEVQRLTGENIVLERENERLNAQVKKMKGVFLFILDRWWPFVHKPTAFASDTAKSGLAKINNVLHGDPL